MSQPITVTFDDEASEFLRALKTISGQDSIGDLIAAAVRTYEWLLLQQKAGNVVFVKRNGETHELVMK